MLSNARRRLKELGSALRFAYRAVRHIPADAKAYATNQKTEAQLVAEQLSRRYDPGAAMNAAFQRAEQLVRAGELAQEPPTTPPSRDPAIAAHYEAMRRNPVELSPRQKAALAVQEKTLRKNLSAR